MDQDIIDNWRDMKQRQAEKRASNRRSSADLLTAAGVGFQSKNDGAHLVIPHGSGTVDFWPGTGRWIQRVTLRDGRGVRRLLALLKRPNAKLNGGP